MTLTGSSVRSRREHSLQAHWGQASFTPAPVPCAPSCEDGLRAARAASGALQETWTVAAGKPVGRTVSLCGPLGKRALITRGAWLYCLCFASGAHEMDALITVQVRCSSSLYTPHSTSASGGHPLTADSGVPGSKTRLPHSILPTKPSPARARTMLQSVCCSPRL